MSNKDKPFVMQHSVPAGVIATRWWWVRHAPVREDNGCIYGQEDIGCDTSDRVVFEAGRKTLPPDPGWYASNLERTPPNPPAIWPTRLPKPAKPQPQVAFAEHHLRQCAAANLPAVFST